MTTDTRSGWIARLLQAWPGRQDAAALPVRDQVQITPQRNTSLTNFDRPLVAVTLALLAMGLVMVYSASIALPDNPRFANYAPNYFLVRQALFIAIGFVAGLIALQVPVSAWERWAPWLFVASLITLVVVLVPFIGKGVNGGRGWIRLGMMSL